MKPSKVQGPNDSVRLLEQLEHGPQETLHKQYDKQTYYCIP